MVELKAAARGIARLAAHSHEVVCFKLWLATALANLERVVQARIEHSIATFAAILHTPHTIGELTTAHDICLSQCLETSKQTLAPEVFELCSRI